VGQVSKPCPNLTLLPLLEAIQSLVALLEPHMPPKLLHPHEKVSDAVLVALEVLRVLHKHPYRSLWFTLVLLNFYPDLPSYTCLGQSGTLPAQLQHVLDRTPPIGRLGENGIFRASPPVRLSGWAALRACPPNLYPARAS